MARRRLPIGMQTFRELRERDCYYVDKTAYIRSLLENGKHYFLSRPRRFGKSLFLDTCKELFEGNEALFAGLDVHDRWDWAVRHPVLRLSFGSGHFREPRDVHASLMAQLDAVERRTQVESSYATGPERFAHLLELLHAQAGQRVAVLIDEYDKPILDALDTPDMARANRDYLRGVYSVVKDRDADIVFSFITVLANDFDGLRALFHAFYASIPHQWYTNNDIASYEGFYASVFYSYFSGLGLDVTVEDSSSQDRLDMAVRFNGHVYLFEFKFVELAPGGAAMAQLKDRRYAEKYRGSEPVHLVAVEFSQDARNIVAFDVEAA